MNTLCCRGSDFDRCPFRLICFLRGLNLGSLFALFEFVFGRFVHECLNDLQDKMYEEDKEKFRVETFPKPFKIDLIPSFVDVEGAAIAEDVLASHVKIKLNNKKIKYNLDSYRC